MAEELSPESKLFVKEEIEKVSKKFKEEVEKVKSKAAKTLTAVVIVVGLLTGLGVYGAAKSYITSEIKSGLGKTTVKKLEADANDLHDKIVVYEKDANDILSKMKTLKTELAEHQLEAPNGYAWIGGIKFVWGTAISPHTNTKYETFTFGSKFPNQCFAVIPGLAGYVWNWNEYGFNFKMLNQIAWAQTFNYVAIGN